MKVLNNKTKDSFEKNSVTLFALMMSANVCNYLFQIIMGHLLAVEKYAQTNAIVSFVGILSIPTTIITMISARYIALDAAEGEVKIKGILNLMLKFSLIIGGIITFIVLLFQNQIVAVFKLYSKYYIIGSLIITIINLFFSITAGTLQGLKHFFPYGMQTVLVAVVKLVFSIILVLIGWQVYGIIAAILIGTIIATMYGLCCVRGILNLSSETTREHTIDLKEFIKYSVGTIISQSCIIALTNGDVLLVKAYFNDTEAGLYSSASVIGKIAMYVSTAIAATLFPMVVEKHQKGEDTQSLFKKAMLYGGGLAVLCALGLVTLGHFVIGILFGERYLQAISMLPAVCLYVVTLTLTTIMMNYLLAIDRKKVFSATILIALGLIIVISLFLHESPSQLMIMAGCVLFFTFIINIFGLKCGKAKKTFQNNIIDYDTKLSSSSKTTVLALSWRDIKSPTSGGAEVHTHQMLSKVNKDKYRIIHLAAQYNNLPEYEIIDGVNYIRKGNIFSVIWFAFLYYKKNRKNIDFVVDQCNTHHFFTPLWVKKSKRIFYIHQLTREIWDINFKPPFSTIGKIIENPLLKMDRKDYTITVSNSTKNNLIDLGFNAARIKIIPNAMQIAPWKEDDFCDKEKKPTFTYVGRYAEYKGIDAATEALGMLKTTYPNAKLWILGKRNENYIEQKLIPICDKYGMKLGSSGTDDVICWGFVSEVKKLELLSRTTALVFPSNREGWGIPVSEAAFVGTPSIVYDSEGLRDAIDGGNAGYLCEEKTPHGLYITMRQVIENPHEYEEIKKQAYQFSTHYLDVNVGEEFEKLIEEMRH